MLTRITYGLVVFVSMAAAGSLASAQEAYTLLNELYGRGVHAYFSSQYDEALGHLDMAVENGSRDPRCYYFRGMTLIRLGRGHESEQQFQAGATLEFSSEGAYDVARSLERIQGAERLQLEAVRRNARLVAMRQPRRVRRIPDNVTLPPETAGTDQPGSVRPASADEPAPPVDADPNDPFASDTMGPIGAGKVEPASPPAAETGVAEAATDNLEDPFGTTELSNEPLETGTSVSEPFASAPDDAPATGTAADRGKALQSFFKAVTGAIPGMGGPATPEASSSEPPDPFGDTADQPAPAEAADPFGGADQAADDLFGGPATGQPPPPPPLPADASAAPASADDDPFGAPANSADDPFGAPPTTDQPSTPSPPSPPASAPAAAEDDPFADLGESNADPFGGAPADAAGGDSADAAPANSEKKPAADSESADAEVDPFADDTTGDPF